MRVAVTGAAGFIGRAVIEQIEAGALGSVGELRLNDVQPVVHPTATIVQGGFTDTAVQDQLIGDGVDLLFHLASLPGAAADANPELGRRVNLDGAIALLDAVARPAGPRVVFASSIAALGMHVEPVNDETPLRPHGSYGTHKAMIELYVGELTRRGLIDGRSVRLAGVVARPRAAFEGFGTAWMSDLFHAAVEGCPISLPIGPGSQVWLQSVEIAARNLVHAALVAPCDLGRHRAWTLPATVVPVDDLITALREHCGSAFSVDYGARPLRHPDLSAAGAVSLGFGGDGTMTALVDRTLARLRRRTV